MSGLSVEHVAGISAFVQELQDAAEGRPPVDEETLALRMLASANTDADFDPSAIVSPFTTDDDRVATMDAGAPKDKFDAFAELLLGDLKDPKEQIEKGMVPKPPPVVVEDAIGDAGTTGYSKEEALGNFNLLKDAQSVCQMFTNIMIMQTNPDGWDITKDAAKAFNAQAKLAYNAMAGPMAGVYNFSVGTTTHHDFTIKKSEVHEKLLGTMFDGMGMDDAHKQEIDSQITSFVKALQNITMDGPHSTTDFALRFGITPVINITGDKSNPIFAFEPTTFLVYLSLDANAFRQSISKNNSEERINLKYSHVVTKFELNVNKFRQMRPKYDAMFQTAAGMSLKEYGDKLNKPAKK